jgi:lysophospholipase L1-like esterase
MTGAAVASDGVSPLAVGTLMMALGDSIAAGIGASHASEGCMAVLAELLTIRCPRLRLLNLSVPGETTETMLGPGGQLERAECALAEALAAGETVGPLTLSIAGNDAMFGGALASADARKRTRANLDEILDRLAAAAAGAGILFSDIACLQTVYNPFEDPEARDGHVLPVPVSGGGINSVLHAAAQRAAIRVAPVSRAFRGRAAELTWVGSGDIHPTDEGHRVIADAYLRAGGWADD